MLYLKPDQIGGALVRRQITIAGKKHMPGEHLSAEAVAGLSANVLRAFINGDYINTYPRSGAGAPVTRHLVNLGFGKFNVIEGAVINAEPLAKEQAEALVTAGLH